MGPTDCWIWEKLIHAVGRWSVAAFQLRVSNSSLYPSLIVLFSYSLEYLVEIIIQNVAITLWFSTLALSHRYNLCMATLLVRPCHCLKPAMTGPIMGQYWANTGPILGQYWANTGPILAGGSGTRETRSKAHWLSSVWGADRMALCFFFTSSTLDAIFSIIWRISSTWRQNKAS